MFTRYLRKEWTVEEIKIATVIQPEFLRATERLKEGKVPSPHTVCPEATTKKRVEIIGREMEKGIFPHIWKKANLALIRKLKSRRSTNVQVNLSLRHTGNTIRVHNIRQFKRRDKWT